MPSTSDPRQPLVCGALSAHARHCQSGHGDCLAAPKTLGVPLGAGPVNRIPALPDLSVICQAGHYDGPAHDPRHVYYLAGMAGVAEATGAKLKLMLPGTA